MQVSRIHHSAIPTPTFAPRRTRSAAGLTPWGARPRWLVPAPTRRAAGTPGTGRRCLPDRRAPAAPGQAKKAAGDPSGQGAPARQGRGADGPPGTRGAGPAPWLDATPSTFTACRGSGPRGPASPRTDPQTIKHEFGDHGPTAGRLSQPPPRPRAGRQAAFGPREGSGGPIGYRAARLRAPWRCWGPSRG